MHAELYFTTTSDDGSVLFIDGGDGMTPTMISGWNKNSIKGMVPVGRVALMAVMRSGWLSMKVAGAAWVLWTPIRMAWARYGGATVAISMNSFTRATNELI